MLQRALVAPSMLLEHLTEGLSERYVVVVVVVVVVVGVFYSVSDVMRAI